MAVVLNVGAQKEDVLTMTQWVLHEYGDKAITIGTDPDKLAVALGIPLVKASQVITSFELGRRYFNRMAGRSAHIRNSKQAY